MAQPEPAYSLVLRRVARSRLLPSDAQTTPQSPPRRTPTSGADSDLPTFPSARPPVCPTAHLPDCPSAHPSTIETFLPALP